MNSSMWGGAWKTKISQPAHCTAFLNAILEFRIFKNILFTIYAFISPLNNLGLAKGGGAATAPTPLVVPHVYVSSTSISISLLKENVFLVVYNVEKPNHKSTRRQG